MIRTTELILSQITELVKSLSDNDKEKLLCFAKGLNATNKINLA
jgi:hypothetical protein